MSFGDRKSVAIMGDTKAAVACEIMGAFLGLFSEERLPVVGEPPPDFSVWQTVSNGVM